MSCSLLIPWLCSLNCLSCGDVAYGISCLCSLGHLFCGDVIYGTAIVCLITCTIVGTTFTAVGIALTTIGPTYGSTLPFIIFCALKFVLSYSLFTFELEAPPFSTLFFLLKSLLREYVVGFFLLLNVIYISSLVFLTLANGFCG
jgi:hypothetical protein